MSSRQKRPHSSTASELDISASDNPVYPVFKQKRKKKSKAKKGEHTKKQKTGDDLIETAPSTDGSKDKMATVAAKQDKKASENGTGKQSKSQSDQSIEKQLFEISQKLSNLLSKDDTSFIKSIIRDTFIEMKDSILSSVTKRIEVLESDVHDQAKTIEKLQSNIANKDKVIENLKDKNRSLYERIEKEESYTDNELNEIEQYSRRNNVRIYGIQGDEKKQSSEVVAAKIIAEINEKAGLKIEPESIDICHRLGQYKDKKHRPIIVKFVRRQIKIDLFKVSKTLRTHNIFVNEDLTKLNAEVLVSCRVKDKKKIEKAWSFEGKIYVVYTGENKSTQLQFKQYHYWLSKPWPEKEETSASASSDGSANDKTEKHTGSQAVNPASKAQ